jgi:peptide/nickel transport system permease protein
MTTISTAPAPPARTTLQARRGSAQRRRRLTVVRSILVRLLRMIGVLWVVSVATFSLVVLLPGDPVRAILGQQATDEQVAHVSRELGLDRPLVERYLDWIGGVLHLDFGDTLLQPVQPVSEVVGNALPITLQLAVMALLLGLAGGVLLGSLAGYHSGSRLDRAISSGSFALVAIPAFVMGLLLIRLFVFDGDLARRLAVMIGVLGSALLLRARLRPGARPDRPTGYLVVGWPILAGVLVFLLMPDFPREGWVAITENPGKNLLHAALPSLTLALGLVPLYAQMLRSDMIQTLRQSFITVARAKGMTPRHIVLREALRPSMFALVTVAGLSFGNLVGGAVVVETIFGLPGLGRLLITSIQAKDFAVVQASVLIAACLFLLLNTIVDITYSLLDPRLRRAGR